MLSFGEFVLAEAHVVLEKPYRDGYYEHNGNVGGHDVSVQYTRRGKGGYFVDFTVNGETSGRESGVADRHVGQRILHFVRSRVRDFVTEKKPSHLEFIANSGHKQGIYNDFASQLARRHNGSVEKQPVSTVIKFQHE